MSWVYGLAMEFGKNELLGKEFIKSFSSKSDGPATGWEHSIFRDDESNFWVHIYWPEITEDGFRKIQHTIEELAVGISGFRFGLSGLETDVFRTFEELVPDIGNVDFGGLILSNEVYHLAGEPKGFEQISSRFWQEKRG